MKARCRYTQHQVIAVTTLTLGVLMSTFASARDAAPDKKVAATSTTEWLIGVTLLALSLLISCIMGLYQEYIYSKYAKEWREGLFYTVPFFFTSLTILEA